MESSIARTIGPATAHAGPAREGAPSRRPRTGVELLRCETIVPRTLEETFAFFSDARNLDRLTPPWVGFQILTPSPISMKQGTLIDYRIRVYGVPLFWRSEISHWDPPHAFVDVQVRGPYRWWHHTHRFEACPEGTRVIDEVEYRAPLARLTHPLMIARDVGRIFKYRQSELQRALALHAPDGLPGSDAAATATPGGGAARG